MGRWRSGSRGRWIAVAGLIGVMVGLCVGAAQQTTVPTIKVTARETVVDVTVTDKDGKPVHGLTQADFTVKEDRKEQPIRSFHEYGSEAVPVPEKLPASTYSNRQPAAASGAVNILLLDFVNSAPGVALSCCGDPKIGPMSLARAQRRQHQTKQAAMDYIQNMPPGTRVAVLGTSDPGSLRVLQGVTSNPALLSAAVDTMGFDTEALAFNGETWCTQQERRNRMTLESLNQIAVDLAGVKGRKNLVWFTTGIPTITDPNSRPPCLSDLSSNLKKAYGLFAAAQITVFPIWVRGVPADRDPFGENHIAEELSMESVAEATGGTAFYNNNDLVPFIAKAIAFGSDYYTLTYVPPGTEYDGRHHTIKLEADQPGLHLTYRDEYYAEDPSKMKPAVGLTLATLPPEVSDGNMRAAMSRSMPTSEQLLFDVRVEPSTTPAKPGDPPVMGTLDARFKDKPLTRYALLYEITAQQIAFASGVDNLYHGALEFDIAVYDGEGKLVTSLGQTITMPLDDFGYQQFMQQPFRFRQQIDLPAGQLFVRIGVLDHTSNKVGTLEIPLKVEKGLAIQKPDAAKGAPGETSQP
jgi:VWFA-related protein